MSDELSDRGRRRLKEHPEHVTGCAFCEARSLFREFEKNKRLGYPSVFRLFFLLFENLHADDTPLDVLETLARKSNVCPKCEKRPRWTPTALMCWECAKDSL